MRRATSRSEEASQDALASCRPRRRHKCASHRYEWPTSLSPEHLWCESPVLRLQPADPNSVSLALCHTTLDLTSPPRTLHGDELTPALRCSSLNPLRCLHCFPARTLSDRASALPCLLAQSQLCIRRVRSSTEPGQLSKTQKARPKS